MSLKEFASYVLGKIVEVTMVLDFGKQFVHLFASWAAQ